MSDVAPELPPEIAEFSQPIRVLWDRDNVLFPDYYDFTTVSARLRQALMDLGIFKPTLTIGCYIAHPGKVKGSERSAYEDDLSIEIIPAAASKQEAIDQGADRLIHAEVTEICRERKQMMLNGELLPILIVVVMSGDGDYRHWIRDLMKTGVVVLSIQPMKEEENVTTKFGKRKMNRAGNFNATMDDIGSSSMVKVKWLGPAVDKKKTEKWGLNALKRKYGIVEGQAEEEEEEEEDWTDFLRARFGDRVNIP